MKRFTNTEKIEQALKLLARFPKSVTVRGQISTRKAASAVGLNHVTLGRSEKWKAALDDYETSRPNTGANQADVRTDSGRME